MHTSSHFSNIKNVCIVFILFFTIINGHSQTKIEFTAKEKAWIKDHPVVKFGYDPDWPPFEIFQNNEYKGIVGEYVNILKRETGINLVPFYNLKDPSLENNLATNQIDFISDIVITEKRKKQYLLTTPFASEPLIIATRKEVDFGGGLSQLVGKKVAIPFNYYSIELLNRDYPGIQIIQMNSLRDCLLALSTGKVDAVVEILGVVSYQINHYGFTNIKIAAPTEYKNIELAMAFDTNSVELHGIMQKVLSNVSEKEQNQIRQKWVAVTYDHTNDNSKFILFIKIFGAVLLALLGIVFVWNRSLRKHISEKKTSELKLLDSLKQISRQNEERKFLLKEIHHRVKNNLQIISSLLKLQAASNSEKKETFDIDATIDRIKAIGLIHEKIYQSPDLNQTNLNDYLSTLVDTIIKNYAIENSVKTVYDIESVRIHIEDMVPLAIIINELVINSLKHGLKGKPDGVITLSFKQAGAHYVLVYSDNGQWVEKKSNNNFGETLIEIFTQQLEGKHELLIEDITKYTITFPKDLLAAEAI
jgi:two-component sensor histidine kinase/ABC-type amino acid transport substrate-binding protein